MVRLVRPPPTRSVHPRHVKLAAGTRLVRIYDPGYLEPNGFNYYGPQHRFDHHQEAGAPREDPARGIYYAAPNLAGCVVEVFGDTGILEPASYRVAVVELVRELLVLDLTQDGAWCAGSVAALTKHADRDFSQQWARYFYEQTGSYGMVDGLQYENAHNAALAYALFERAGTLRVVGDVALSAPGLEGELATIAAELGLILTCGA